LKKNRIKSIKAIFKFWSPSFNRSIRKSIFEFEISENLNFYSQRFKLSAALQLGIEASFLDIKDLIYLKLDISLKNIGLILYDLND